jgi:rRNA processing protein Gar1
MRTQYQRLVILHARVPDRNALVVEAELHHVAIIHDVILALNAGFALGASLSDRARLDEVVEADAREQFGELCGIAQNNFIHIESVN